MKNSVRFLIIIFSTVIISCGHDRLDVDVSKVQINPVKIERFDEDFFKMDTARVIESLELLEKKYGSFTDVFVNNIVCQGMRDSLTRMNALKDFVKDPVNIAAFEEYQKLFSQGLEETEAQLNSAFRYFKYHFPKRRLPARIYALYTRFAYNFIHSEGEYGISLEFHLGPLSTFYERTEWPRYKRSTLSKEYIVPKFVKSWMMNEFPFNPAKNDVLNNIVYEGKLLYLSKALLYGWNDTLITGFTRKQTEWCETSEASMWANIIEKKLLYSESEEDINHLVMDGPFTPGFPRESPGKAGIWIGLRIVEAFMEKNEKVTLEELMAINDAQVILSRSKYKPKF